MRRTENGSLHGIFNNFFALIFKFSEYVFIDGDCTKRVSNDSVANGVNTPDFKPWVNIDIIDYGECVTVFVSVLTLIFCIAVRYQLLYIIVNWTAVQ